MEESMEEGGGYDMLMDDHNHNNWEANVDAYRQQQQQHYPALQRQIIRTESKIQEGFQPLCEGNGLRESESATNKTTLNISGSTSKFLMNVITTEDYQSTYWPKLDSAIDQLLTQSPGDYIPISYEQIYSCVYKCVCQQHSEQMYSDLIRKITNHLQKNSEELQASPPDQYVERFNTALSQYMGALQSIVPLFIYMNKFYIETKLNRDLKDDLIKLFTEHVAEKHVPTLMHWIQLAPSLFSKFIPNILPPAMESELQHYAAQDQKLQRELMENGFARGDQSRKRAGEELTYNGSSTCASSKVYR
ncbi:CDK2-associated and cullin domain-containing protein 1 isoform X2 [Latimeria chalumnae]|uniref:CDK2-associated and cullin domain-containing protein 1 isoform X2 n=1 Tax=Latimeria chalumnae TaxID=7897 RepID=UPI0003C19AA8|nr:PREDICTED: CDK2-associated and cullin domain-containing protein 1 isoform X3 [Latimeria chalumnae]|eukprot:XP_006012187.1 PREDICTED: CDK2-associated and cullin domain-containing protein 1 isoform X3 [Latimeria chalumnae]